MVFAKLPILLQHCGVVEAHTKRENLTQLSMVLNNREGQFLTLFFWALHGLNHKLWVNDFPRMSRLNSQPFGRLHGTYSGNHFHTIGQINRFKGETSLQLQLFIDDKFMIRHTTSHQSSGTKPSLLLPAIRLRIGPHHCTAYDMNRRRPVFKCSLGMSGDVWSSAFCIVLS